MKKEPAMSITGVSSSSSAYKTGSTSSGIEQIRANFENLVNALQLGNLAVAQSAFGALQQAVPSLQAGGEQDKFTADVAAIGKALQSGNMSSAQDAYKKLQQDLQQATVGKGRKHHHHHHHHRVGDTQDANGTTSTSATQITSTTADSDSPQKPGLDFYA
jgi:hypothetical protein